MRHHELLRHAVLRRHFRGRQHRQLRVDDKELRNNKTCTWATPRIILVSFRDDGRSRLPTTTNENASWARRRSEALPLLAVLSEDALWKVEGTSPTPYLPKRAFLRKSLSRPPSLYHRALDKKRNNRANQDATDAAKKPGTPEPFTQPMITMPLATNMQNNVVV